MLHMVSPVTSVAVSFQIVCFARIITNIPVILIANSDFYMCFTDTSTASSNIKNGGPFPRACPKCNIHFNLMDPLKNHMKVK